MSWRDREYATSYDEKRGVWRVRRPTMLIGGSIVTTLIMINVGVYVLAMFSDALGDWIYRFGELKGNAVLRGELWRLVTAQYLHDRRGIGHLLLNMLALHFLGRPLEQIWSARRFFVVYTLCGAAGSVFFVILASRGVIDPRLPAVGASGCIYGLLGIAAVLFPTATVYIYMLFPIRIRTAAMVFGGIAILSVLGRRENYGGEACHLAGLAFGVWWAWKGDAWWRSTQWRFPAKARHQKRPTQSAWKDRIDERAEDQDVVDGILKKVYEGGVHTLTESEKRALQEATERQRQREAGAGRVDRL